MKKLNQILLLFAASLFAWSISAEAQIRTVEIVKNGQTVFSLPANEIEYMTVVNRLPVPEAVRGTTNGGKITITWDSVNNATSYKIFRSADKNSFSLIGTSSTNSFTDNSPLSGSNYYRVQALGVNEAQSEMSAMTPPITSDGKGESGIYLGIIGFNQQLYSYPIEALSDVSKPGFDSFIDDLTMKNGTLLYYSVDQAINTLQSVPLPADLSTVAIVTFTDGLDQGSMMMNIPYGDDNEYLDALNHRIMNDTVNSQPITAFSIGIRGKDVADIDMFRTNLAKLAYDPKNPDRDENPDRNENAFEVSNMAEVNAKFKKIAEKLSESNYVQTINLKMPGLSNGTRVRFTFDNVNAANNSTLYIEGTFNLSTRSLENVKYEGLTSTSGSTIKGVVDGIFVTFTFEGVHTDNNVLIDNKFTDEWTYITSNNTWQINSEFDKTENSDIVTERSSAVIMLVLDCSSSLADDFVKAQTNAKDFISTLYQAVGGIENPGEQEETIYSTNPQDLSVAIWKDGTRYYLTPEQYKNANLSNIIVEGLTIIGGGESFILSLNNIQTNSISDVSTAKELYGSILPTQNQGKIISARWTDVNNALSAFGGTKLGEGDRPYYTSSTSYSSGSSYPWGTVIYGSGGSLYSINCAPYIRGVYSTEYPAPIEWTDQNDLKLSVIMNGERVYLNQNEYSQNLSNIETIEGVLIIAAGEKFIISLNDAQSTSISNVPTAQQLYLDIMPTQKQGRIISARWTDVNNALSAFGGTKLGEGNHSYYTSSTSYSSGSSYPWGPVISGSGGRLYSINYAPHIRGVISVQ